jgi:hypothetical protein
MRERWRLSDPLHNLVHLGCAGIGLSFLVVALLDWIDHLTTLEMMRP